jgi:hypothetical protein
MPETKSARNRMLASKRADVGSTLELRIDVSKAMFCDCYVKPAAGKGANITLIDAGKGLIVHITGLFVIHGS